MKHYAVKKKDGGVAYFCVVDGSSIEEVILKFPPHSHTRSCLVEPFQIREAQPSEWPTDRTFRSAWRDEGQRIGVDMPKAREIHRNKLREMRKPRLLALDAEYLRADEAGDVLRKTQIAAQKQTLRDCTAYAPIDAADSPDQLNAAVPPALL